MLNVVNASDSSEQQVAEREMLLAAEEALGIKLDARLATVPAVKLDGFCDGALPICVEAWAHQGKAIGSQPAKLMTDMCKLLLVERLLGRPCRKILLVCNDQAVAFLKNSGWKAKFMKEFGIELLLVRISDGHCAAVRKAQDRQYR